MSYPNDILSRMFGGYGGGKDETLLYPKEENQVQDTAEIEEVFQTNIFNVMLNRRSHRRFEDRPIEDSKLEMIFAAADTAPTAGGFQGFEIYHVKSQDVKLRLVEAANNQPYVNAPVVLVFCMNPGKSEDEFPAKYYQEVFSTRFNPCSRLFAAGSPCIGIELRLDRND